jgi:hypothetical protein
MSTSTPPMPYATAALGDPEWAALGAVVAGRWAWSAQIYLAASGHEPATLAGLVEGGHLEPWELPDDPRCPFPAGLVLTLTPATAEALGVEIVEEGPAERPRWARVRYDDRGRRTDRGKPAIRAFPYEVRLRMPELVPDPAPGPEFLVDEESGEEVRLIAGGSADEGKAGATSSTATTLKGGLGGGPAERGYRVVRDRRMRGKR